MFAWRSRFEPSGACESLRCSERMRSKPILAEICSVTASMPAVERIDGVDHDGFDRARRECLVERRGLLGAMGARLPAARGLAEDLDRLAAALEAALHRELQAARERDVGADQHARSKPLATERR